MLESVQSIESLPFAFAAAIAPALDGDLETTTVRAIRHSADTISLEIEAVCNVGLTFWASGAAEMTWEDPDSPDVSRLQNYTLDTTRAMEEFLHDLRIRLHEYHNEDHPAH